MSQYPWSNTTENIAAQEDARYETPGGAQNKIDTAFNNFKNEVELPIRNESIVERHYRTESVSPRALAQKAVQRRHIATGSVGYQELDPALLVQYADIAINAKFAVVDDRLNDTDVITSYNTARVGTEPLNIMYPNPPAVGAKGDNITDDYTAIQNLINSAPAGSTVYVPDRQFRITGKLTINKNLRIVGCNIQDDRQNLIPLTGSIFNFDAATPIGSGIECSANGIYIENIYLNNSSTVKTNVQIGISILPFIGGVVFNVSLTAVWSNGFGTHGIYGDGVLVSKFEKVFASNTVNGFYFDNQTLNGTSVYMSNCWALRCTGYGYYFYKYYYMSLVACASDDVLISYVFSNCTTVVMSGCGSELTKHNHIDLNTVSEFTAIGCLGYQGNLLNAGNNNASFLSAVNCNNITLIGCKDQDPAFGDLSLWSNNPMVWINCDFPLNAYVNDGGYANTPNTIFGKFVTIS